MDKRKSLNSIRSRRQNRNSTRIIATLSRPRLIVSRSNTSIYAQLVDDVKGVTLVSAQSREVKAEKKTKTQTAGLVGELLAKKASEKGIKEVVFDRKWYKYHGRVRAFAEGARSGGLIF